MFRKNDWKKLDRAALVEMTERGLTSRFLTRLEKAAGSE